MDSFLTTATDRRSIRRAVRIDCQVVRERDFRLVGARALDLSVEGMLVAAELPVLTGEIVLISFELRGTWLDAEGVVARVVHGRRPLDRGLSVGVAFTSLSSHGVDEDEARDILRRGLRGSPPPLPARAPRIDWAATARTIAFC